MSHTGTSDVSISRLPTNAGNDNLLNRVITLTTIKTSVSRGAAHAFPPARRTHFRRHAAYTRRVIYSPVYIAAVRVICNAALPMRHDVVLDRMTVINPIRACGTARTRL